MKSDFNNICIVGLGLIGGSVGLAIKKKKLLCKTIGYAKTKKTLTKATDRGLVDSTESTLSRAVEKADLVILATPLSTFKPLIQEMAPFLKRGCIITDTGSAKYLVIEELKDLIPYGVEFVPGHPIAGTEESGPDSGFPELFENRWCILTPTKNNSKDSIKAIKNFWELLGSKVEIMDALHHDKVLAITSHIPHLIAYNIVGTANDLANVTDLEVIKYSAGGFRDFTRIAASDPKMWSDCLLYTSPSPRDRTRSRMPSSA